VDLSSLFHIFLFTNSNVSFINFLSFYCTATKNTKIYTLSLHDALPIYQVMANAERTMNGRMTIASVPSPVGSQEPTCDGTLAMRSEEHTSELQSRFDLVCRLLLEKKKLLF